MSKILLEHVGTTMLAALLYLGAGIGIGLGAGVAGGIKRLTAKNTEIERLTKKDFPFVVGMILLDIAAPIFLMLGLHYGTSSNASLRTTSLRCSISFSIFSISFFVSLSYIFFPSMFNL